MNRRLFGKLIASCGAAPLLTANSPRFANRKRLYGRFNASVEEEKVPGCVVFLNGKEVKHAMTVNTETGIIHKHVEFDDGIHCGKFHSPKEFPGRDVLCPIDNVVTEMLHGEVEMWGPENLT